MYRDAVFAVSELIRGEGVLSKDPETGLYDFGNEGVCAQMLDFKLSLTLVSNRNGGVWAGHSPAINFRFFFFSFSNGN
jgi:hypothetical protein